jgi:hypothetical protein
VSTLNPFATPFRSAGASSSRPSRSVELLAWIHLSSFSSNNSEPSESLVAGKRKAPRLASKDVAPNASKRGGASQRQPPSRFMAASRCAPPPSSKALAPQVEPDTDGWREVVHKKRKRKASIKPPNLPQRNGRASTDLIGLFFNCFSREHVTRRCPTSPSYYLRYRQPGHQMKDCHRLRMLPLSSGRDGRPPANAPNAWPGAVRRGKARIRLCCLLP